ncbi:MAG: hypothetical protein NC393_02130 [Clostridium sp.]|nr:hypothetical protein [Clostridium sp.]MCM1170903.1 hypothetical protein [Clostridium sp.]MCM1207337.1 hypothetical protein [Ruminococcus sp.]
MKKKKYQKMLLKNTLAVAIPAIAVFLVLVFLCIQYPIFDYIECKEISSMENIDETLEGLYAAQTTNVKLTADSLKYTGLDYYEDGKQKGSYYYMSTNNKLILFLIKTDAPAPSYEAKALKGTIIRDNVSSTYIMGQFAEQAGIDQSILAGYCSDYIVSEVGYPFNFIVMVYILFIAPIVISIIILMYTVYVMLNPQAHPQSKQLAPYGKPAEIIYDINTQLTHHLLYKKKHIYITEKYMIVNYLSKTDVIKLDMVKYLSKNVIERPKTFGHASEKFRLTLSNPDTLFYEVDFNSEEVIDAVIRNIGSL